MARPFVGPWVLEELELGEEVGADVGGEDSGVTVDEGAELGWGEAGATVEEGAKLG